MRMEHDLERLIGGFAADTLTPEEKQRLYSAALQDQQLFDVLADEQALRELLADPAVRCRLVQALKQTNPAGAGSSSWLDWLSRPSGLAWAGGLAAAVFAVVLGTRIYQDSLRQASQYPASEKATPVVPPASISDGPQPSPSSIGEPEPQGQMTEAPPKAVAKKEALPGSLMKQERVPLPRPREQKASDALTDRDKGRLAQDRARQEADAPVADLSKSRETISSSADQKVAAGAPPAASATTPLRTPAAAPAAGVLAPVVSARALFYGEAATRPYPGMTAQEQERAVEPMTESAPQAGKLERRFDESSQPGRAKGIIASAKPLGLRYSFVLRGTDMQDREVDARTAFTSSSPVYFTVEANQDAFLQIWKSAGSSTGQWLSPDQGAGQSFIRMATGQRWSVLLPMENGPFSLTVRLSRVPFEPVDRGEAVVSDRPPLDQIQESVAATGADASQELATYVVNRNSSSDQVSVTIPIRAR